MPSVEEIVKLILQTEGAKGLEELAKKAVEAGNALKDLGKTADTTGEEIDTSLSSIGTKLSGLFTTLKEGDVGGIADHVGDLVKMIPTLAGWATPIVAIGGALAVAVPLMNKYTKELKESLETFKEGYKIAQETLEQIRAGNFALLKDDAIEKAKAADSARRPPLAGAKERGEIFTAGIAGHEGELQAELIQGIVKSRTGGADDFFADIDRQGEEMYKNALKKGPDPTGAGRLLVQTWVNLTKAQFARGQGPAAEGRATETIGRAKAGDPFALKTIQDLLPPGHPLGLAAKQAGPEEQAAMQRFAEFSAKIVEQNKQEDEAARLRAGDRPGIPRRAGAIAQEAGQRERERRADRSKIDALAAQDLMPVHGQMELNGALVTNQSQLAINQQRIRDLIGKAAKINQNLKSPPNPQVGIAGGQ